MDDKKGKELSQEEKDFFEALAKLLKSKKDERIKEYCTPGDRIGAFVSMSNTENTVQFLGWGTYEGEEVPPGLEDDVFLKSMGNPKLKLDDGRVVWGYQCWWGPEEKIKTLFGDRVLIPCGIDGTTMN